jgi:hypothetical protein
MASMERREVGKKEAGDTSGETRRPASEPGQKEQIGRQSTAHPWLIEYP